MESRRQPRLAKLILLILIVFLTAVRLRECSPRDTKLERVFAKELSAFKQSGTPSLDLRTLLGTHWKRVCHQNPYTLQDTFEEGIGQKVYGFEEISDDVNTLWIFYDDDTVSWVQISQAVMDWYDGKGTECTSANYPMLYSEFNAWNWNGQNSGRNEFYFLDDERKLK